MSVAMENFTLNDICVALNEVARTRGGQAKLARKAGVSRSFVNLVVDGERDITDPLIQALGFRKVVSYRRISE